MSSNVISKPQWPSEILDEPFDFIGVVPGDCLTIRVESNSFLRIFIYKSKSPDPVISVEYE